MSSLGYRHTKNARKKISEANREKKLSWEHKKKISESHKGEKNPMWGKKHSEETKKKIRKYRHTEEAKRKIRAYKHTEEAKMKISKALKERECTKATRQKLSKIFSGRKFSKEWKQKISIALLGRKLSEEHRQKISKVTSGENNPSWQGGISFEPYGKDWTERLKRQIRERDNYICQLCGKEKVNYVHHIDYDKKNCNSINLINLCVSCNAKINANREYWTNYFKQLVNE